MHIPAIKRTILIAGMTTVGTAGLFAAPAMAADSVDAQQQTAPAQAERQSEGTLSERVKRFNQSGGSMNPDSAARPDVNRNNDVGPYTTDEQRSRDESIGKDVSDFNRNRGSLQRDSATGSQMGQDGKIAPYTTDEQRARDERIGEDLRDFNQAGGSLNRNSAGSSDMNDNTGAQGQ